MSLCIDPPHHLGEIEDVPSVLIAASLLIVGVVKPRLPARCMRLLVIMGPTRVGKSIEGVHSNSTPWACPWPAKTEQAPEHLGPPSLPERGGERCTPSSLSQGLPERRRCQDEGVVGSNFVKPPKPKRHQGVSQPGREGRGRGRRRVCIALLHEEGSSFSQTPVV